MLSLVLLLLSPGASQALNREYKAGFKAALWGAKDRGVKYAWGFESLYTKANCSGLIFAAAREAGIPGIRRTTALEMRYGRGGWTGHDVGMRDAEECDLIWFSWKNRPDRPHGHVGVLLEGRQSGNLGVLNASQTRGFVIWDEYGGVLERDTSAIRRLTIGDPQ